MNQCVDFKKPASHLDKAVKEAWQNKRFISGTAAPRLNQMIWLEAFSSSRPPQSY